MICFPSSFLKISVWYSIIALMFHGGGLKFMVLSSISFTVWVLWDVFCFILLLKNHIIRFPLGGMIEIAIHPVHPSATHLMYHDCQLSLSGHVVSELLNRINPRSASPSLGNRIAPSVDALWGLVACLTWWHASHQSLVPAGVPGPFRHSLRSGPMAASGY